MDRKPDMVLFDYGQTLIDEHFNPIEGNRALLRYATKNPNNVTAEQMQEVADTLIKDIVNPFHIKDRNYQMLELTNYAFEKYLFDFLELDFPLTSKEMEWIFWSNASHGKPTSNIQQLLSYLNKNQIRTAVASNISFSSDSLIRKINELIPNNHFEFVIASSDYIFRKPHPRIFEIALKKAKLPADQIWFCGDNLYCDIEGSYNAGMKPFWYPTYIDGEYKVSTVVPFKRIDDWMELINLIEHM